MTFLAHHQAVRVVLKRPHAGVNTQQCMCARRVREKGPDNAAMSHNELRKQAVCCLRMCYMCMF